MDWQDWAVVVAVGLVLAAVAYACVRAPQDPEARRVDKEGKG